MRICVFYQKLALERVQHNVQQLCALLRHGSEDNTAPLTQTVEDTSFTLLARIGDDVQFLQEALEE